MFDHFWWHASVLLIGSLAIYWIATQKSRLFLVAAFVLSLSLLSGLFGYTRFGQMFEGKAYHYSEIWHYYLGSKYYKELSQQYLYVAIIGAFEELKATRQVPHVEYVRNLQQPFEVYSASDAERVFKEEARSRFTDARWAQFKADVEELLNCPWHDQTDDWKDLANEAGFNPPPSYSALVGNIASLIPINPSTIYFLPCIDWSFTLITAAVVFRTFGFLGAAVFLLIFWTNDLANLYWIGGSFCRYLWFSALTMAICALEKKRYLLAGAAYGLAIALRVFPFVFLLGACLPFLLDWGKDWRKNFRPIARLLLGAMLVLSSLVLISLILYPLSNWTDFFSKISFHNKILWVMHLGFDKWVAYAVNLGPQYFNNGPFWNENWNIFVNDRFNEHWMLFRSIPLLLTAVSIFVCLRAEPKMASLLAGTTLLFFYALPSNYYYVYLATFGVVLLEALKQPPLKGNSLRFWYLMIFLIVCNLVGGFTNQWVVLNGWINNALFCLLLAYIVSLLFQESFNWKEDKFRFYITIIGVLFLALMTFRPRVLTSTNTNGLNTQVLIFAPQDIESGSGGIQNLPNNSFYWHTQAHLLANNPHGLVSIVKHFVIPQQGKYLVTVFYVRQENSVDAQIKMSCIDPMQAPMDTWSPSLIYDHRSYDCEFPAGVNSVQIFGSGDPAKRLLGVNSIILKPL